MPASASDAGLPIGRTRSLLARRIAAAGSLLDFALAEGPGFRPQPELDAVLFVQRAFAVAFAVAVFNVVVGALRALHLHGAAGLALLAVGLGPDTPRGAVHRAPHLVRAVVQVSYREQVWLASGMGGVLLVAADILARALIAPQELPVGVRPIRELAGVLGQRKKTVAYFFTLNGFSSSALREGQDLGLALFEVKPFTSSIVAKSALAELVLEDLANSPKESPK